MPLACVRVESPVGPLLAVASELGLCGLPFLEESVSEAGGVADTSSGAPPGTGGGDRGFGRFSDRLQQWFGSRDLTDDGGHPVLRDARDWLAAYFEGSLDRRVQPPLDLRGAAFELTVWRALMEIPVGCTTSYGDIARRIGSPGGARAVGLANGANPVPIIVPCHRVIGASGDLTGYGGGLPRKTWLLAHEQRHWGAERSFDFA